MNKLKKFVGTFAELRFNNASSVCFIHFVCVNRL